MTVSGYIAPDPVDIDLNETGANVLRDYTPNGVPANGVLGIAVNNIEGGYLIHNALNEQIADVDVTSCGPLMPDGFYHCSQSLGIGFYTVTFKSVPGYITPAPVDVDLMETGKQISAKYMVFGPLIGNLKVGLNNANGGFKLKNALNVEVADVNASGCGPLQPNGYYMCSRNLPLGFYTVEYKGVGGYITPATEDVDLNISGATVYGDYTVAGPLTGNLQVGVNLAGGGYTIENAILVPVGGVNPVSNCGAPVGGYYMCGQTLGIGFYTVKFTDVPGYIKPADIDVDLNTIGATVYATYTTIPTGVIQVQIVDQDNETISNLPAGEWELQRCLNADPASCSDVMASGGAGGVYNGLAFATYRIVFPNPVPPAGYTGRTVDPFIVQVLDSGNTSLTFIIKYTEEVINTEDAYVNVQTSPVKAHVRMITTSPAQPNQNEVTSHVVVGTTYDLAQADRFTLPTSGGVTASTDYSIVCLPAPGGYHAPANPIVVNNAVYTAGSENLAGLCTYTAVPNNEKVTISVDTIGVDLAAIYVDGVEVRATTSGAETFVVITTTEAHTISFEDKDPTHFTTPVDIAIPANSLNSSMTPDQLKYLGYYVALGNMAVAEVNTENQNGWVYLTIGADATKWNVGYATTDTLNPLVVHFDETVSHEFHFQDRNAPANPVYFLRAVPVADPGFSVSQTITQAGGNVTYFQERYTYAAPHALTTVHLVGDYIAATDAAFFRARTTNADPVYGNINLVISGDAETLRPGAQIWTRVFISDVVNDSDTTGFESPITVNAINYAANPLSYNLSTYAPGAVLHDLESTYVVSTASDLTVELVSPDPLHQPTAGLTVTLDTTNELTIDNAGTIEANFTNVNAGIDHTVHCPAIAGLATPNDIAILAGTLLPGDNTVQCVYASAVTAAHVLVQTEASDNVNFEAPIVLNVDGTDYPVGSTVNDADPLTPATLCLLVDTAHVNAIRYGNVSGYITPAAAVVNVVAGTDCTNPANVYTGLYTHGGSNHVDFNVTTRDNLNNPLTQHIVHGTTGTENDVATPASFTVTQANLTDYIINFSARVGFVTPGSVTVHNQAIAVIPANVTITRNGAPYVVNTQIVDGDTIDIVGTYTPSVSNSVNFNVATQDNLNVALTQHIVHGVTGTENDVATPAAFAVTQANLTDYIINFTNRAGYITPGSVTIHNQAIASVPANVTITHNGSAYVPGTQLVLGDTYIIVGTYTPGLTIDKSIVSEQTVANNNKRVNYQIVVTRPAGTPDNGTITIALHDSIAPSRSLTGSNGGTMTVVPQNGVYSTCSNNCGDITAGSVNVSIDHPGNSVTITYQLLSNNAGIPAASSSNFTNNLTGSYTDSNNQLAQLTDSVVVNVLAAPTNNGPSGPSGGGGGGAILIRGDMILEVTKLVSLDNNHWVDASDETKPLVIPSRVDSKLYTKVNVKNLGQVTATNIKYSEGFDEGDSLITTEDIDNVEGDTGISFNDATNTITINEIKVGGETNFTYDQVLHEDGSKGELAEEYLVLDGFSTKLGANQDGLTKHGIGDHYPSWLTAGSGTVVITDKDLLELYIRTDKAAAKIGEEVVYTITAKNNADYDFTGTTVTWAYDKNSLEILNPNGGRDNGTEISWNQGTLKPGQTVTYTVRTKVKGTAPVGGNVRTTARGLVNEIENPSVAEHFLSILAGVGPVKLAQTGASATFGLMLISLLGYLAYMNTGRRRYLAIRKAALRPL